MILFQNILDEAAAKGIIVSRNSSSQAWFRNQAAKTTIQPTTLVTDERAQRNIEPGSLILFKYSATHTLPYYDAFPLIFYLSGDLKGFVGMNMHYINYRQRAVLMDNLYSLADDKNISDSTRIYLSYQILNRYNKFKYFKPCVKRYLYKNVKSRFLHLKPTEWELALFMPLERFVGASKEKVWDDSNVKINKGL